MNKNYQKLILALCIAPFSTALYAMDAKYQFEVKTAQAEAKAHAAEPVAGLHDPEVRLGVKIIWSQGQEIIVPYEAAQRAAVLKSLYAGAEPVEGQLNYEINIPDNFKASHPSCSLYHLSQVVTFLGYSPDRLETALASHTASDLLQIYKISSYLDAAQISSVAIKALPQALTRLARESGLAAVKNFLDTFNFNDQESSALKKQLMQNNPWIRYCCGSEQSNLFDIKTYIPTILDVNRKYGKIDWQLEDDLGGITFGNGKALHFPGNKSPSLVHPEGFSLNSIAFHKDRKKLVVIGRLDQENAIYFWQQDESSRWHSVRVETDRIVHPAGHFVIGVHWVDENNLVTISGRGDAWTLHYWKLEGNTLVHDQSSMIPDLKHNERARAPLIAWRDRGCAFVATCFETDIALRRTDHVYEYRNGEWKRDFLKDQLGGHSLGRLFWQDDAVINYKNNLLNVWRLQDDTWHCEEFPVLFKKKGDLGCIPSVKLSPDGTVLLILYHEKLKNPYLVSAAEWTLSILKFYDGAWHQAHSLSWSGVHTDAKIAWNNKGNKLLVGSTFSHGDVHMIDFNQVDVLSYKDLLLCLVCNKLTDSPAGQAILRRDQQILKSISKVSPALQDALHIKPKWYSKEALNQRAQKIQRWIKRNPKAALALCVAGGLLAYYAKKRLAPRVKKSIIMPLVARLKRKAF